MSATDLAVYAWCMVGVMMSFKIKGATIGLALHIPPTVKGFAKLMVVGPVMWAILLIGTLIGSARGEG